MAWDQVDQSLILPCFRGFSEEEAASDSGVYRTLRLLRFGDLGIEGLKLTV